MFVFGFLISWGLWYVIVAVVSLVLVGLTWAVRKYEGGK